MKRVLIAMAVLSLALPALADKPVGAPPSTPEEASWFAAAHSQHGGPCCDQSDGFRAGIFYPASDGVTGHPHPEGVILQDWKPSEDQDGGFDVRILGKWMHVDKYHIVPGVNPTGEAVVWVAFNSGYMNTSTFIRCFAPGNLS